MAFLERKWISDSAINNDKIDHADTYQVGALQATGDTTTGGNAKVMGNLLVSGRATLIDATATALKVTGPFTFSDATTGSLTVSGLANLAGDTTVGGNFQVNGTTTVINTEISVVDKLEIDQSQNQEALVVKQTGANTATVVVVQNAGTGPALTTDRGGIGIGTTNPQSTVHVSGTTSSTGILITTNDVSSAVYALASNYTGTPNWGGMALRNGTNLRITSNLTGTFGGVEGITVQQGGNVGIGTTNPLNRLHVSGNFSRFSDDSGNGVILSDTGSISQIQALTSSNASRELNIKGQLIHLYSGTSYTENVTINSSGYVGIGASDPLSQLHAVLTSGEGTPTGPHWMFQRNSSGNDANLAVVASSSGYSQLLLGNVNKWAGIIACYHGDNSLRFAVDGTSAATPHMMLTNEGKVGIGSLAPVEALDVFSAGSTTIHVGGNTRGQIKLDTTAYTGWQIEMPGVLTSHPVGSLGFTEAGVGPRVTFMAGGNVGIGTNDPNVGGYGAGYVTTTIGYKTTAGSGNLEFLANNDVDDQPTGNITFTNAANTSGKIVAWISGTTSGTTSANRGGQLRFYTKLDGSGALERMRITNDGYVGIGITNPTGILEVMKNDTGTTLDNSLTARINVLNGAVSVDTYSGIRFSFATDKGMHGYIGCKLTTASTNGSSDMVFAVKESSLVQVATEYMRLQAGGNFGIGTTDPQNNLHVNSSGGGTIEITRTGNTCRGLLTTDGTLLSIGTLGANDISIQTNSVPRMTINSSGNVGIGTNAITHLLDLNGGGYYSATYQWINGSSRSIKQDIVDNQLDVLGILSQVNVVNYRYKTEVAENPNAPVHIGFIADDTPPLLSTKEQNGMATGDCIGLLLGIVKEQQKQIAALQAEVTNLKQSLGI